MIRLATSLTLTLLLLLVGGCSTDTAETTLASPSSQTSSPTATVRLESVLARAVPAEVTDLRLSGLSNADTVLYGPQTRSKSTVVEFTGVPITVTRLRIEYLANERVIGLAMLDVHLQEGQVLAIADPSFTDVDTTFSELEITPASASIAQGSQLNLSVVGRNKDKSVTDLTTSVAWSAEGSAVSVNSRGVVTGLNPGTSNVTARIGSLSSSATIVVTGSKVVSLLLTPSAPFAIEGVIVSFRATATFSDQTTQDVTGQAIFTSSNPSVASIAKGGTATTVASGQAVITATFGGTSTQATLLVTSETLQSLAVNSKQTSLGKGTSLQLQTTGVFSDGTSRDLTDSVLWTSSDPSVVQVNSGGLAVASAAGSADIRVTLAGVSGQLTLTVTDAVLTSITLTPKTPSLAKGVTQQFTVRASFSDQTTQEVTNDSLFQSSSPAIATVSTIAVPRGLATAMADGQTTISARYQGMEAVATLTVTPATLANLEIFPASSLIAPGRQRRLGLVGVFSDGTRQELSGSATWSTASGGLSVDVQGLVSVSPGTALGTSATITASVGALSTQAQIGVGRYAYALGEVGLTAYSLDGAGGISVIEALSLGLPQGNLITSASGRYLYANTFSFGAFFAPTVYKIRDTGELDSQGTAFFNLDTNLTFHPKGRWAFMNQAGSITTYEMTANGSLVARQSFLDTGVNFGAMAADPQREVLFVLTPDTNRVRSFAINAQGGLTPLVSINPQFPSLPTSATELFPDSLRGELFGIRPGSSFSAQRISSDGALSDLYSTSFSRPLSAVLGPNSGRFVTFLTSPTSTLRSASSFSRTSTPSFTNETNLSLGTEVILDIALSPAEDVIYGLGKMSGTIRSYRFNSVNGNLEETGSSAAAPVGTGALDFSGGALVVAPPADLVF